MPTIWPKISYQHDAPRERSLVNSATVQEMRDIVGEAVNANRDRGRSEAVFQAARELGLSQRRIVAILRAEVGRVWADELDGARRWYAGHCARKAERLAHEATLFRARADALRERLG